MAKKGFVNDVDVTLDGACTMERAADLHACLAGRLATLTEIPPSGGVRIDVAQVTAMDACGCQLLALFLEQLRRLGIAAAVNGAGDELRERIELLGFSSLFSGEHPQP